MARITVEDCLQKIPNRFQLVLAATYRARMLSQGHAPRIESKNKPGVTALREIAEGKVGLEMLKNFLDVSRSAQEFKLLTMRGDFMANQAQYEYEKRTRTQPSFI